YLKVCKEYINRVISSEPEVNWGENIVDAYNVLWDTILTCLDDLREYIQARKKVVSEFEAHMFWVKQALEADNVEDAAFYLKHALEDLIDMKSSVLVEKELADRLEEEFNTMLKVMEGVKAARKRAELFEETYPRLEKLVEEMIRKLKESNDT
ncbi:MAG: hypothetical protein QXM12_06150, partial [Nitrososphaerota archaeon]